MERSVPQHWFQEQTAAAASQGQEEDPPQEAELLKTKDSAALQTVGSVETKKKIGKKNLPRALQGLKIEAGGRLASLEKNFKDSQEVSAAH